MNYKIVNKDGFKVAGVSRHVTTKNGENFKVIPQFWDEICNNGTCDILDKNAGSLGVMGICYNFHMESGEFDYIVAVEGETVSGLDSYQVVDIPEYSWAVFESVGQIPNALQDTIPRIYSEWLPTSKYQHAGGPELEVYLPGDTTSEDYKCEMWIPVVEKA